MALGNPDKLFSFYLFLFSCQCLFYYPIQTSLGLVNTFTLMVPVIKVQVFFAHPEKDFFAEALKDCKSFFS